MYYVDKELCTGCGICEDFCEKEAIKVEDDTAVINYEKCNECGTCKDECPNEAIKEKK